MAVEAEDGDRLLRAVRLHIAEPNIIEDDLLRGSIVAADYLHVTPERYEEMRSETEFKKVEALQLSFQNILQIQNLAGFDSLTKLQLDNNIIEKIENLGHLTNLTWLDLSFNNIAEIEGLENLTKLTDLSLFANCIRSLKGMDTLENLNLLSLGKNLIPSLDDVLYLRRFRNLKMLTLAGNKMAEDPDYRNFVVAHLSFNDWKTGGHLSYLDYRLVEAPVVAAAREQFQDAMLELADKEKVDAEAEKVEEERLAKAQQMVLAGIKGIDTLAHDMLAANPEVANLSMIPGYDEKVQDLLHVYKQLEEPFVKLKGPVISEREQSVARFEKAISQSRDSNAADGIKLITRFRKRFKRTAAQADQLVDTDAGDDHDLADSVRLDLRGLRGDLKQLTQQLFELQLQHKAVEEEFIAELERNTLERKRRILDDNQSFFAEMRVGVNEFVEQVRADANAESENVERLTEEARARQERGEEVDEVAFGDLSRDAVDFLLDKELVRNSVQASQDFYLGFIDAKETEITVDENTRMDVLISHWTGDSGVRDRERTGEIMRLSHEMEDALSALEAEVNDR